VLGAEITAVYHARNIM